MYRITVCCKGVMQQITPTRIRQHDTRRDPDRQPDSGISGGRSGRDTTGAGSGVVFYVLKKQYRWENV